MSAEDMRKLMESITPVINEMTGCDCASDCECGGSCEGKCGDASCPCECGDRTGVGINECGSSIYEQDDHGIVEKDAPVLKNKKLKRQPSKDVPPPSPDDSMSPGDIDLTTPEPEKVSQTMARAALHGKDTTHSDTNRSGDQPTGWVTPSITGFVGTMPNPKLGGVYSPAKAWLALMKQPDTVTLYKHGKGNWDITQGGYMVQKGTPDAWTYIQSTHPTGPIIVVDMESKFVKRIALDSQSMKHAIDGGSFDITKDKGDDNWNTQYGFRESINDLEEQFKALLKK